MSEHDDFMDSMQWHKLAGWRNVIGLMVCAFVLPVQIAILYCVIAFTGDCP